MISRKLRTKKQQLATAIASFSPLSRKYKQTGQESQKYNKQNTGYVEDEVYRILSTLNLQCKVEQMVPPQDVVENPGRRKEARI